MLLTRGKDDSLLKSKQTDAAINHGNSGGPDSKDIRSKHDLLLYLESKKVGQPVELSVIRDGSPQQIMVILGQRPALGEFS